jgi:hypothetical protein
VKVESIRQEKIDADGSTLTEVVLGGVDSLCILTRVMIKAIGRPGVDSDLEFLGSGDRWTLVWTYPCLSPEEVLAALARAWPVTG